jgi:1,2-dihydroxy-3-keto-5-methylthiopentene dioxygenase
MAVIRTHAGKQLSATREVTEFLAANGIEFATWGVERVPKSVSSKTLSPAEKEEILAKYKPELDGLIARRGYVTADMVSLSPETPKLPDILATFKREHYHTDDEVRFVAAGRGIFFIRGKDGNVFECEVLPGDLIVVPANTWHYFDLCEDQNIACVRVFKTKDGWVANFKDEQKSVSA